MPFLNDQERELVKKTLSEVMTDADLSDAFNHAQKRHEGIVDDYTEYQLRQFMGIIKDIQADRAAEEALEKDPGIVRASDKPPAKASPQQKVKDFLAAQPAPTKEELDALNAKYAAIFAAREKGPKSPGRK